MIQQTKIFYVEDERDNQTIARLAFEKIGGFSFNIFSSGNEALAEIEGFEPDIILLEE